MPKSRAVWAKDGCTRLCGTPGCTKIDQHDGPCSNAVPLEKRPRYQMPPPKPRAQPPEPKKRRRPKTAVSEDAFSAEASAAAANLPELDLRPAVQAERKDGLRKFYHVHRWGAPLPDGPVAALAGNASDDEVDGEWRREEVERRTRRRPEVSDTDASFIEAWNAHVHALPTRLVSDRMLPEACRRFVTGRDAAALRPGAPLHRALRAHLTVLWEHNLLQSDDVHDCLLLSQPASASAGAGCAKCARPLHESHCALAGRARGAAAWPTFNKFSSQVDQAAILAATVRSGGAWE